VCTLTDLSVQVLYNRLDRTECIRGGRVPSGSVRSGRVKYSHFRATARIISLHNVRTQKAMARILQIVVFGL